MKYTYPQMISMKEEMDLIMATQIMIERFMTRKFLTKKKRKILIE
jgi:hypothetical protein